MLQTMFCGQEDILSHLLHLRELKQPHQFNLYVNSFQIMKLSISVNPSLQNKKFIVVLLFHLVTVAFAERDSVKVERAGVLQVKFIVVLLFHLVTVAFAERDSVKVERAGVLQVMSKQHQLFIDFHQSGVNSTFV